MRIDSSDGEAELLASYVVGCDGGRSIVRHEAKIAFDGFTHPERFIKIATTHYFALDQKDLSYRNYFSDPAEWCNLFKVRGERQMLWRAILPIGRDETDRFLGDFSFLTMRGGCCATATLKLSAVFALNIQGQRRLSSLQARRSYLQALTQPTRPIAWVRLHTSYRMPM